MRFRVEPELRPEIGKAITAARKALGLSQGDLASILGSKQSTISRWARGADSPPVPLLAVMARLVPDDQKPFWNEIAGITTLEQQLNPLRSIPVLRDAAGAGPGQIIDEKAVDYMLMLPLELLPKGGNLVGLKVTGDSMSPLLEEGFVVLVDVSQQQMAKLVDTVVAVYEGDLVTIKWLRRQGEMYLLVPQNTSHRNKVQVVAEIEAMKILGRVVKWIGGPPTRKKSK